MILKVHENRYLHTLYAHLCLYTSSSLFELKLTVVTIVCDINVDKRCE
jgi:hypothetical protein